MILSGSKGFLLSLYIVLTLTMVPKVIFSQDTNTEDTKTDTTTETTETPTDSTTQTTTETTETTASVTV